MLSHRLALRLRCTLEELDASMSYAEFERWRSFDQIEPIGDRRLDELAALIAAAAQSAMGGKCDPNKFLPKWGPQEVLEDGTTDVKGFMRGFFAENNEALKAHG